MLISFDASFAYDCLFTTKFFKEFDYTVCTYSCCLDDMVSTSRWDFDPNKNSKDEKYYNKVVLYVF